MNIAYITNFFPPTQTGTAQYTADLAQAMTKIGHHVTVICPSVEPSHGKVTETMLGDVIVVSIPGFRLPKTGLLMGFDDYRITWADLQRKRLLYILSLHCTDIIHQCGHLLDLTDTTTVLARKLKVPCVCSVHTMIGNPTSPILDTLMQVADRVYNTPIVRRYDRVIALDQEVAKYVRKRYGIIPTVLPYGVNLIPGFHKWDDGHKHFQITSVGHVTKMRSREDLLRACDELIEEGLDIRVSIIGKVCYQSKKHYRHSDRFRFEGEWYNAGIKHFWETSDLEAHWITTPGLGTAILEAMACGVPCMTNGYEGLLASIPLKSGRDIGFVRPDDIKGIKSTIKTLYNYREIGRQVGEAGKKLVEDYLIWDKVAPQYVKLYQEVTHNG